MDDDFQTTDELVNVITSIKAEIEEAIEIEEDNIIEKEVKKSKSKKIPKNKVFEEKNSTCLICKKNQVFTNYYLTNSILFGKTINGRLPVCKNCLIKLYDEIFDLYENPSFAMFVLCRLLDAYFDPNLVQSAQIQATNTNSYLVRIYFQKINSMLQYKNYTFKDSPVRDMMAQEDVNEVDYLELDEKDRANRKEVISLIGYDPFESSDPAEKGYLYDTILSYLDEATVTDSFKLSAVIEIVKSFSQVEIINGLITTLTKDVNNLESNMARYKMLLDLKKNIQAQIMSYANSNGITASKSKGQTKGAGTFSGILKELRDKKIRPSDVNLFDIQTEESFKKVADISNRNIINQLQLNESDYSNMIIQQREKLKSLNESFEELQEKNRILLKENSLLKEEFEKIKKIEVVE